MRFSPNLLEEILRRTDLAQLIKIATAIVCVSAVVGGAAKAAENETYESLLNSVIQAKDCTRRDDVDLMIFSCEKTQSLWYFTKPGHPAHPGVVRKTVEEEAGTVSVRERGWSFASDAAQPAFKTFLAQLQALDEQLKEGMAVAHGAVASKDPPPRIYGNLQPQGSDNAAILSLTRRYFALEDGGHYEDSYALLDASLTAMLPFAEYKKLAEQNVEQIGQISGRSLKTIDWEKDSPLGPPGIYAAVDYTAEGQKGQVCGFVAWRKAPDGFFTLVREETATLPNTLTTAQVVILKAKFHCVD
jgi:hypothetical protein